MNILGREFVAEQIPEQGWVICAKWIDGVLRVISNTFSNKKQAHKTLNVLEEYLVKHCRQLGLSAEQYWQCYDERMLMQWMSQL